MALVYTLSVHDLYKQINMDMYMYLVCDCMNNTTAMLSHTEYQSTWSKIEHWTVGTYPTITKR